MPNLRSYYRMTKKGKVVNVYATDGTNYYCDVQLLKNDESEDENEAIIPKVEIPIMWAGNDRGIVAPPEVGVLCDVSYYDGDPNFPRVSNFRYQSQRVPDGVQPGELLIQKGIGNYFKMTRDGSRIEKISNDFDQSINNDLTQDIGGDRTITTDGNSSEIIRGDRTITVDGKTTREEKGELNWNLKELEINTDAKFTALAGGSLDLGGGSVNMVSEGSLSTVAAGEINTQSSTYKQTITNAPPVTAEESYDFQSIAGNYKLWLMTGLYDISNTATSLHERLTAGIDFQVDILKTLDKTISKINELTVGTGTGNSSTPLNGADLASIQTEIQTKTQELEMEKTTLGLLLK